VVPVKEVPNYPLRNAHSVPFIGANPLVWQRPAGIARRAVRVAVIDTGVDYKTRPFAVRAR